MINAMLGNLGHSAPGSSELAKLDEQIASAETRRDVATTILVERFDPQASAAKREADEFLTWATNRRAKLVQQAEAQAQRERAEAEAQRRAEAVAAYRVNRENAATQRRAEADALADYLSVAAERQALDKQAVDLAQRAGIAASMVPSYEDQTAQRFENALIDGLRSLWAARKQPQAVRFELPIWVSAAETVKGVRSRIVAGFNNWIGHRRLTGNPPANDEEKQAIRDSEAAIAGYEPMVISTLQAFGQAVIEERLAQTRTQPLDSAIQALQAVLRGLSASVVIGGSTTRVMVATQGLRQLDVDQDLINRVREAAAKQAQEMIEAQ